MKISPILVPKTISSAPKNIEKTNNNKAETTKCEPFWGKTYNSQITFEGKKSRALKKETLKNTKSSNTALPMFEPYFDTVIDALKEISSKGKCIITHNKYMDSIELFKNNLKSLLETNKLEKIGFNSNTYFIDLNLADYAEDSANAFKNINKDLTKKLRSNSKPIILATGVSSLFDRLGCPSDFFESSIFQKYPTIFFMEEGYNAMRPSDINLIKNGLNPHLLPDNQYIDMPEFRHQLSKYLFLKNSSLDEISFPRVESADFLNYMLNKDVQKKLINQGNEMEYEVGVLDLAFKWAKASSYKKEDFTNSNHHIRLLDKDSEAIQTTIDVLRRAVALKLILQPDSKVLKMEDVIKSFPQDVNWLNILDNYRNIQKLVEINLEAMAKKASTEKSEESEDDEDSVQPEKKDAPEEKEKADIVSKGTFEIVHNPKTKFSDIGGMYNIKRQLQEEFIDIIKNPEVKNSQKPSGVLLAGPPGCGKTLLARAIAGETGVPFLSTAGSSFVEIYVGTGAKRVRELYEAAREEAKNHPSKTAIVFIDEVDAVAGSRKTGGSSEDLRTINALLHEMDGSDNKDENDIKIITIVATNNEDMLDSAFKRSGRIDLKYTIDDPRYSVKAREEILKIHAKDLKFHSEEEKTQMLHNLAVSSSGLSGADLAELLKKANRMSMSVHRKDNCVTEEDINEAKMQIIAGIKTDIEHTDYELKQTVAHEAGHAVAAMVLEKIFEGEKNKHKMPSKVLDFITNSARGNSLGATYFKPSEENKMGSKETCLTNIIGLYGGYAIESELFDTHSSGVSQDLDSATSIIENAVSKYDFGSEKHYLSLTTNLTKSLFAEEIKQDMLKFSKKGMELSKEIIKFAKPFIESYISEFISNSTLDRTVTAEEFKAKFNKWLESNNKQNDYKDLCQNLKTEIEDFCKEKTNNKGKFGF